LQFQKNVVYPQKKIAVPEKAISGFNQPIHGEAAKAVIIKSEVFPHEHFLYV
jgi:hypothetical protein